MSITNWNDIVHLELSNHGIDAYNSYYAKIGLTEVGNRRIGPDFSIDMPLWEAAQIFGKEMRFQFPFRNTNLVLKKGNS